nr:APC family permease [Thiohalobacter sp.]
MPRARRSSASPARPRRSDHLSLPQVIAMGVGGMIGGGIFSVLGLAIAQAGHAAPLAFALGGAIALLTGLSYAHLGLSFRSDGGSFTYLEHAFRHPNIAGMGGWLLLAGYVGTLALYAYTFGAYGSALLGQNDPQQAAAHHLLQTLVLLAFLGINLYGVRASGTTELLIVTIKVLILGLFAVIGLWYLDPTQLVPVLDQGTMGLVMGAALIFVAYEGFELIPNAINEMENPERNLGRGIFWAIGITISIYVLVALVAVGNLRPEEIRQYGEYALAVAAQPFLGQAGFLLIGLAALFSTASAINATLFGTARLGKVMAEERELPAAFAFTRRQHTIPWFSLIVITGTTLAFVNLADLSMIASFSSSTFLLVFLAINLSAWRLRKRLGIPAYYPLAGVLLSLSAWVALLNHLWETDHESLYWTGAAYLVVAGAEFLFSRRRLGTCRSPASGRNGPSKKRR